jgi:phosphatidate cytidylyltransferase
MFRTRFFSSVILLAITLAVVVFGGNLLYAVLFVISLIGMMELYRIVKINKAFPGILGYLAGIVFYLMIYFNQTQYQLMFLAQERLLESTLKT